MLSGEGNAGERWKTAIGLISKKATLYVPHTFFLLFFCRCFERLQRESSRNFLVTRFFGGNVVSVLVDFFFFFSLSLIFTLVAAIISHFLTAATKFSCCSSNKKWLLISCSSSLLLFFSLSCAGLSPTFPISLSSSSTIFQIFGHDN